MRRWIVRLSGYVYRHGLCNWLCRMRLRIEISCVGVRAVEGCVFLVMVGVRMRILRGYLLNIFCSVSITICVMLELQRVKDTQSTDNYQTNSQDC